MHLNPDANRLLQLGVCASLPAYSTAGAGYPASSRNRHVAVHPSSTVSTTARLTAEGLRAQVRTSLVFGVGPQEVPSLRMIERHYFRDTLIRSYDFTFGFCIPSSVNSWDAIYPVPELSEDRIQQMIDADYESTSDSFYFVGDKLVMHNKAAYSYKG